MSRFDSLLGEPVGKTVDHENVSDAPIGAESRRAIIAAQIKSISRVCQLMIVILNMRIQSVQRLFHPFAGLLSRMTEQHVRNGVKIFRTEPRIIRLAIVGKFNMTRWIPSESYGRYIFDRRASHPEAFLESQGWKSFILFLTIETFFGNGSYDLTVFNNAPSANMDIDTLKPSRLSVLYTRRAILGTLSVRVMTPNSTKGSSGFPCAA